MKNNIRLVFLAAVIILSVTTLIAQTKDIVYLKNGSVIKGAILEMIPDKTIKIQTVDGNIFVYNMSEVERISKEAVVPTNEQKPVPERSSTDGQRSYEGQRGGEEGSGPKFSIYGGAALPMGDFGKKDDMSKDGFAKTGWSAGLQFVTGGTVGWIIDGSYSQNKFDLPTTYTTSAGKYEWVGWSSILALTGIKIGTDNSSGANFFFAPLVGAIFAKSPEVNFTPNGISKTFNMIPSGSGTAFAYGGALQVIFGGHVTLNAKYIASKPKFKFSVNGSDYESDPTSVAQLFVSLGVAF